jgi:integral membrane protein (TIGR01906 family)
MKKNHKKPIIISWMATALIPLIILMLTIRLLITPVFAQIEYRLPGFPDDPYGFTMEERLQWAEPSITYLVNSEDIGFLESVTFENGEPIYNSLELNHMQDVKNVVTNMRIALAILCLAFLGLTITAVNSGRKNALLKGCARGAWVIVGLIVSIIVFLVFNFDVLFTGFHQLFFESGTWKFYTSDTLIRLFPMRFWRDAFIFVGILSLGLSGLVIFISRHQMTGNSGD